MAGMDTGQTAVAGGKEFTLDKTRFFVDNEMVPVPFHPGAERFRRERGVLK
jgi:TRAP-type uncharacterized transport system substrate-binding protein